MCSCASPQWKTDNSQIPLHFTAPSLCCFLFSYLPRPFSASKLNLLWGLSLLRTATLSQIFRKNMNTDTLRPVVQNEYNDWMELSSTAGLTVDFSIWAGRPALPQRVFFCWGVCHPLLAASDPPPGGEDRRCHCRGRVCRWIQAFIGNPGSRRAAVFYREEENISPLRRSPTAGCKNIHSLSVLSIFYY